MPRAILPLALLAVVISLVAAFAPGPPPSQASIRSLLGVPVPEPGGEYRAPLSDDPPTFDPALAGDTTSLTCALQLYDGLVRFQEGGKEVAPALAERWTISEDGITYTFHLREGVRFRAPPGSPASWNRPIHARDVKYSFERVLWPEIDSPAATTFMPILGSDEVQSGLTKELSGIRALDEHTVEIRLKAPFSPFLSSLTMPNAFIVQREVIESPRGHGPALRAIPVGTGPFYLVDYVPRGKDVEAQVVMARNEQYWDQTPGQPRRPYLDRLVFVIENDEATRYRMFQEGKLHHTEVPDPEYEKVAKDEFFLKMNQLGTYYLGFQVQTPPFDDLRVRRAFSHAIDKASIVQFIRARRVQAARGPLPPNIPGYNPNLESYEYDPEMAETLLDRAGFPRSEETRLRDGFPPIRLQLDTNESNLRVARAVQANLLDVGIRIGLERLPWAELLRRVREGEAPFHRMGWAADYLDADNFLYYNFFSGNIGSSNGNFYANRDVDLLLQEAREINNWSRRMKLYNKAEQLIAYDAPWICLYYYQTSLLRRPEVHGLNLTALGAHMIRYDTVWLDRRRPVAEPPE